MMRHSLKIQGLDRTSQPFDAVLNKMPHSSVSTISEHANMLASCSHDGSISVSHAISVAALDGDGFKSLTVASARDINHAAKDLFLDLLDQAQRGGSATAALRGPMAVGNK